MLLCQTTSTKVYCTNLGRRTMLISLVGMFIPAGSTVIAPLYGIHLNENDYPDPNHFKPSRFMETPRAGFPGRDGHNSFGWGELLP